MANAKKPRKWYGLVVHHSGGSVRDTVGSIRRYHIDQRKYRDIGYHYVFQLDGKGRFHLKAGRSTELPGCHGNPKANSTMLGVCVAGNYDRDRLSDDQYKDILGGVVHILQKHGIAPEKVWGHCNIKPTDCPGTLFPLNSLKQDVKDRMR